MADYIEVPAKGDQPGNLIVIMNDEDFKELGEFLPAMPRPNQITEYLQERYDDWKRGKDGTDDREE